MQRPYAYTLRRATTAAALTATFVVAPLFGPTAAHANPRANSCANQEADCQSMAHSIARGTSSSKAKKVVCTSKNTAQIILENGDSLHAGWLGGLATGAVFDGFSGLPTRNCAFKYTCPHTGIRFETVFCSKDIRD